MEETIQNEHMRHLKHNYFVNLMDGAFFGFAIGFASFSTILPLFVSTLTNSATLIGLIPAIHNTGWQLPQLLTAKRIGRMIRYKPFVMLMTIHERIPFLGIAIVALLVPIIGTEVALIATYSFLIWQGLGGGLTANAWQILIGKVIPPDYLATFFGFQSAVANLLASGGAVLAGVVLENISGPWDFATCFLVASVLFAVSWYFLNLTLEFERKVEASAFSDMPLWQSVRSILSKDTPFRWYLVTRIVSQFGNMAFVFYTVYAVRQLAMSEVMAGVMTGILMLAQVITNPLLGWIADRWGKRNVLAIGSAATAVSAFLAFIAPDLNFFYAVFLLAGIGSSAYWTIGMAFTMGFGTEEERPTYVGMANTLIAPAAILAPLIGGWIADIGGFRTTFIFASFAATIAMIVLLLFVCDKTSMSLSVFNAE